MGKGISTQGTKSSTGCEDSLSLGKEVFQAQGKYHENRGVDVEDIYIKC